MSKDRDERQPSAKPAEERPRRVVSLLGQRPAGGEAPSSRRTADAEDAAAARPDRARSSGADPLRSEHSTFRDLEAPRDDFDPERAHAVCAQVARAALLDFAPALVLLPSQDRARAQAVIAYARTLLDFARDLSLEGERLAQINRFEFALEAALGGDPPGQPVFVQMRALEEQKAWAREAFDAIAAVARSRVSIGLPTKPAAAEAQRRRLAGAALHALLGAPAPDEAVRLGAAVLRAASLLSWHDALWFHRPDLGLGAEDDVRRFAETVTAESRATLAALDETRGGVNALPARLRPAARYVRRAAAALTRRAAERSNAPTAPRLSVWQRLRLLASATLRQ